MGKPSLRLLLALTVGAAAVIMFSAASASAGGGSQIPIAGTGSPHTGAFTPSGSGDVTGGSSQVEVTAKRAGRLRRNHRRP